MAWPLSQDYNEVIQSPALCFSDPELGQAEARCNAIGIPMPRSGNFADVYEMAAPGGKKWAVKCFTRQVAGLRERYAEISAYLKQVKLPFMVDFTYLDAGIKVRGQPYPILKMDWVEGFTLNEFIKEQADNPPILDLLAQIWLRLAHRLREAGLAHCDLQHGNVLLVPGSQARSLGVRLIDYDGMFVPALGGKQSGEVGHPAYQHPQRLREGIYSAEVDRFPHLVIYTALRCLMVGGRYLWNKYDNGDNLIFRQADLNEPGQSALFAELLELKDAEVHRLVQTLAEAAQQPLDRTPLLEDLAGSKPAPAPRRSAVSPARPEQEPLPETIFAEAAATAEIRRTRRSAQRSYRGIAVAGLAALAGLVVVGFLLAMNRKPRDTGPAVAAVPSRPASPPKREEPSKAVPVPEPAPPIQRTPLVNSLGMKLAPIPAGKFLMGAPPTEEGQDADGREGPQHEVEITQPFYMGVHEVTVGQFRAFVKETGYLTDAEKNGGAIVCGLDGKWAGDPKASWHDPRFAPTDAHPVVCVSWNDAQAFCNWLSKQEGRSYRLPTEAQWEYACRAGSSSRYGFGDDPNELGDHSWYHMNSGRKTHPVGQKKPNALGLYDMLGNAREWTADWFDKDYYQNSPRQDPQGPSTGKERVMRGYAWNGGAATSRIAFRGNYHPTRPSEAFGFRVVLMP